MRAALLTFLGHAADYRVDPADWRERLMLAAAEEMSEWLARARPDLEVDHE
jgi:hypothetical protein